MDGVLNCLSKAWQKPDYAVRRSAVGPMDRERIFPEQYSWGPDSEWYVGPPVDRAGDEEAAATRRTRSGNRLKKPSPGDDQEGPASLEKPS